MPLKIFGKQAREKTPEAPLHTFLCAVFVNQSVQAALWKIEDGEIRILSQSSLLAFENDEDGLIKTDQALQELGAESEHVNEIVFGFDIQWVDEAGLLKEKKPFIKNITESLGLKPVGFVVITDALAQQVIAQDSLASQVLVYIQNDTVALSLIKQGKLLQHLSVGRSEDIVQDIVEGLARLAAQATGKEAYLPAKLALASPVLTPQELDDAQDQIANYNWSENHPFVQAPVIETMLAADVLRAVVEQGGMAVAESKGLKGKQSSAADPVGETAAQDFGFEKKDFDGPSGDNFEPATSFGVPIAESSLPDVPEEKTPIAESSQRPRRAWKLPPFLKNIARWYENHPHKKIILGGAVGGVLALVLLFIGWIVLSYQVAVSVQLAERVITKDIAITLDPNVASTNAAAQILKASMETAQVDGQETLATTGVTLVGEKASGTVTLFNKTTAPKTFAAGTVLSADNIAFTLNEEVTVASASVEENDSGTGETKNYGQIETKVTARDIGANGNISQGTELTVANFSSGTYAASAKEGLSGGSSREVRVVSQEDQAKVLEQLRTKLIDKANQDFQAKSGNGTYYLPSSVARTLQAKYDNEVGKESDQLKLDLSLEVSAVVYRSEELRPLLEEALKADIPEGYQLIAAEPEVLTSPREATASSRIVLDANVTAKARPPFDAQTAKENILGQPLKEITARLDERPEIERATYELRPRLARFFVSKVPKTADRIVVEVTNQEE